MQFKFYKSRIIPLLSTVALPLFASTPAKEATKEKPNVILILSDDHSFPHVGCYGDVNVLKYNITPNLDAFAKQGIRFERAYTTAPQSAPSRTSIFTGCSPVSIDVTRFAEPSRKEVPFFTDILRKSGYWVGLDGRNHHLDGAEGDKNPLINEVLAKEGMRSLELRFDHVAKYNTKGTHLAEVPQRFSSVLDEVPKGKPFFLYFGFNQPHRKFEDGYEEINPDQLVLPPDFPDLPEVRKDYARYLSDVRDMDGAFGAIMKVLEDRKLTKNTIVIFMGDNGESLLRGKGTLHSRGLHVPLIIRFPGVTKPNTATKTLVSGEDIAPTILELLGLNFEKPISGRSFSNTLKCLEDQNQREYVFGERGWHFGPLSRTDGLDFCRSVTSEKLHFIYNALPKQEFAQVDMVKTEAWEEVVKANSENRLSDLIKSFYFYKERPIFELYDLENDPFELKNLSGQKEYKEMEKIIRNELEKKMLIDHDYLPLPTHVIENNKNKNKNENTAN
ncbi:MAG: sulfatase [Paludibacter sp.]